MPHFLLVSSILFVSACASLPQPIQSPNDDRAYRYLTLDNDLQVLLISDPGTDKSAAALAAFRGWDQEPADHPGLAHFLEHMLFLGTERYPEADGYQKFVATHGGSVNAYTLGDHTNFFFDIEPDYFFEGLDRFSQFFVAPLFQAEYVEREKNAVHSEYQLQLKDDRWRGQSVRRVLINPEHPESRFHIGSAESLAETDRATLIEWFEANYSADEMGLVVLSSHDLDEIEAQVRRRFTAVANRNIGPPPVPVEWFGAGSVPSRLQHRTIKNTRRVVFTFPIAATDEHYRTKPTHYIANMLGHEGKGSLHTKLKARGWIESLGAGSSRLDSNNAVLSVNIEITDEGIEHIDAIRNALFAYIELAKSHGVEAWRYGEQALVAELGFRFQEKSQPIRTARAAAAGLRLVEPTDLLRAPYMMEGFDAELIDFYFGYLTPKNLITEISGPDVETDAVEPWFEVPYRISNDASSDYANVIDGLALPTPNEYLPENLELVTEAPVPFDGPTQSTPAGHLDLWMAPDTEFGTPRQTTRLKIHLHGGLTLPSDIAHARLYARLVQDELNTSTYPAQLAGLSYRVGPSNTGFGIAVSGYDDKMTVLFNDILEAFGNVEIEATKLATHRVELGKNLDNFKNERPYSQAMASLNHIVLSNAWPPTRLKQANDAVDKASLEAWRKRRLSAVAATLFVHGNIVDEDAEALVNTVRRVLRLGNVDIVEPTPRLLARSVRYELDVEHNDAAYLLYVQGADTSFAERARVGLLARMLRTEYFNSLRTEQQLGYVVTVVPVVFRTQPGLAFVVQSPVAAAGQLETATYDFVQAQLERFRALPESVLEQHKRGFIARLLERDKNLYSRSQRLWSDLDVGIVSFDSREQIATQAARITRDDLVSAFINLMDGTRGNRVVVYSKGQFNEPANEGTLIEDIASFKMD